MPSSPGSNERPHSLGADPTKIAEWESETYDALRRHRDAATPIDDELPDEPLADLDETQSALERLRRA